MKRTTSFLHTKFPPHVIREAAEILFEGNDFEGNDFEGNVNNVLRLKIGNDEWVYDSLEHFFANYPNAIGSITCYLWQTKPERGLRVIFYESNRQSEIEINSSEQGTINKVFTIFERAANAAKLPPLPETPKSKPKPPVIFIGHGRSPLWRDLKDHLADKHDYRVEAYEVGARAGHTIRDILKAMLDKSSFACLVLTAEDEMGDGTMRARQNVVHEAGLFQGRLGFSRAILMLEEGTEDFSNVHGVQQIRFAKGNIKETFGEVLATLRREFNNDNTQLPKP